MGIPLPAPIQQLVNGKVYDFSSIEVAVDGVTVFSALQEINYSDSLEPGILRGTSAKKKGRTRGEYDAEGSIVLAKKDSALLIKTLAALGRGGFMEAEFDLMVAYAAQGDPNVIQDVLRSCRVTNNDNSHSQGTDPTTVTHDLDIMDISYDGARGVADDEGASVASAVIGAIGGLL